MICGAQVELNISQRGWDELFEIMDANGQTVEDPTRSYTRKMTYIDIPSWRIWHSEKKEDCNSLSTPVRRSDS